MSERTDLPLRLRQEVALEPETQRLLWDAASEIERLRKVIDDYVGITQASSKEIKSLRAGGAQPALTDEEREAVEAVLADPDLVLGDARGPLRDLLNRL